MKNKCNRDRNCFTETVFITQNITHLSCMIKIILFRLQLAFVSFVSNIIQFTFVVSVSSHSFIKINADAVGFHITHSFTKVLRLDFNDANHVVHKVFAVNAKIRHRSASEKSRNNNKDIMDEYESHLCRNDYHLSSSANKA